MVLALTDHDDVAGLDEASRVAAEKNITFINGVEISVTWRGRTIHILGLNVDPDYKPLFDGLTSIRDGRTQRARTIADELEKVGVEGSFEGAFAYVGERGLIGRTHFARFLVEKGYAKDMKAVFKNIWLKASLVMRIMSGFNSAAQSTGLPAAAAGLLSRIRQDIIWVKMS